MFNFKQMFVLFRFRKSDSVIEKNKRKQSPDYDTLGSICCRITIDNQVGEIGLLHITLKRSAWDEKAQLVLRNDVSVRRYNRILNDIKSKLERIYELLQVENGGEVTPLMVKEFFTDKKLFRYSFDQLISEYFKDRNQEVLAEIITQSTINVHENYSKNFMNFLTEKGLKTMLPAHFDEDSLDTLTPSNCFYCRISTLIPMFVSTLAWSNNY